MCFNLNLDVRERLLLHPAVPERRGPRLKADDICCLPNIQKICQAKVLPGQAAASDQQFRGSPSTTFGHISLFLLFVCVG